MPFSVAEVGAIYSNLGTPRYRTPSAHPQMHQNSRVNVRSETRRFDIEPKRNARKIVDGRGLYLLVTPTGGRYWRYNYRFEGKHKTLALGVLPEISLEKARARHEIARALLADGVDPSTRKRAFGNSAFNCGA